MDTDPYKIKKDSEGRIIFYGTANNDYWWKKEFDSEDNCIYYEDSKGFWVKKEFKGSEEIYFENSFGVKWDKR